MIAKRIILLVCVSCVLATVVLSSTHKSKPTISFVEYRNHKDYGKVAVFRITNSARHTFSYDGFETTMPLYMFGVRTVSGWHSQGSGWRCSTGAEYRAIGPQTSVEFEVVGRRGADSPFAVGICFEEGTPKQIARRKSSGLATVGRWLRSVMHFPASQTDITWSQLIEL